MRSKGIRLAMAGVRRRGLLALPAAALAAPALADEAWPNRPIRVIVPFAAGGPIDTLGRLIAEPLRERLGQPFVIDNRGGAGGSIGLRTVVQAPPDGYTLVLTSSSMASLHAMMPREGLDSREVVTPISLVIDVPTVIAVRAAATRPGRLHYGSGGVGSSNHLSGALFASKAGVDMVHVSYRGAAAATTALIAGETEVSFASSVEIMGHAKAGRVRMLAVTSAARAPGLPELPAAAETVPGYAALNWYAMAGPRGLPPAMVAKLSAALAEVRALPAVRERILSFGATPLFSPPEDLATRIAEDTPLWQRVVAEAGIRTD